MLSMGKMRIEIGEKKTLEFKRDEFKGAYSLLPVSVYDKTLVSIELLEINKSMEKSLKHVIATSERENVFITIIRYSTKTYIVYPGAAIIEKVGKSLSV